MKGGQLCDTFTGFGTSDPTMLERLERNVRKPRVRFNLGFVDPLFLSDVLLSEVERRWCKLDNIVSLGSFWTTMWERNQKTYGIAGVVLVMVVFIIAEIIGRATGVLK